MKRMTLVTLTILLFLLGASSATSATPETPTLPVVGDVFVFGQYEQDNNTENGLEPIRWLVLAQEDGRILLLSEFSLDYQGYHQADGAIVWKDATIRAWLNEDFLQAAFSPSEQAAILALEVPNAVEQGNAEWQTLAGDNTTDSIFLLSIAEANQYFMDNNARKSRGTETARAQGARLWPLEETDWWLRSTGRVQHDAAYVGTNGGYHSNAATNKKGIRPALWFDTTAPREAFSATQHQNALSLFDAGQFEEAISAFEALGTYSDSESMVLKSKYEQAMKAVNDQEYAFAITLFEGLGDYSDSYEQARECRYLQALVVQESGDHKKAVEIFGQLGHYKDSIARA